jgi:putative oxidoreductase
MFSRKGAKFATDVQSMKKGGNSEVKMVEIKLKAAFAPLRERLRHNPCHCQKNFLNFVNTNPKKNMSAITKIEDWGNSHRPGFLDIFRIVLGLFITYKGFEFLANIQTLELSIQGTDMSFLAVTLAHYVVFAHVLCGPMIVIGLFTRIMCAVQLPILIGAVILVNFPKGFLSVGNHMELELSLIVLAGLVVFMIFGAGKFSIDEKRRREKAMVGKA